MSILKTTRKDIIELKEIVLLIIFIFHATKSLFPQDSWVHTYRPFQQPWMIDRYEVEDVLVTQDGGYAISGSFELYDEFNNENWGFLMKTDSEGNLLWAVKDSVDFMSYNGYTIDFTELHDGSFISIGYQGYGGARYMIKRDSQGNREWAIPYNTDIGVFAMRTTSDGNVILAGRADYNAALRKITPDGETLWTNIIEIGSSIAYSVSLTNDNGYLLAGTNYENHDILVVRTNAYGDSLWTRTYSGYGNNDKGHCVIETDTGRIIVGGTLEVPAPDYGFGFIACLEEDGDTLWTKVFDDGLLYSILSVIQTYDTNFVLQGGKLVKIDSNQIVMWSEPLIGDVFGEGDKNLQELSNNGLLCVSTEDYGDYIVLNKTNSDGQVTESNTNEFSDLLISLSNFPNPFNPITTVKFQLPKNITNPKLEIFNLKGQIIDSFIINENQKSLDWNAEFQSSGLYFYRIICDEKILQTSKMTLIK